MRVLFCRWPSSLSRPLFILHWHRSYSLEPLVIFASQQKAKTTWRVSWLQHQFSTWTQTSVIRSFFHSLLLHFSPRRNPGTQLRSRPRKPGRRAEAIRHLRFTSERFRIQSEELEAYRLFGLSWERQLRSPVKSCKIEIIPRNS